MFTATNALELGINAPTIRAVVHVGTVRKMQQYAQESRRAERDSQKSEAIIMQEYREIEQKQVFVKFSKDVEQKIQNLIREKECMQRVINKAIDRSKQR